MKNYDVWMQGFMDAWKNLDGEGAMKFIAKDAKYFETPNGEPCSDWNAVRDLWVIVPYNQKDITYSYKMLCANDEFAIINWNMTRTMISATGEIKQQIDGIFQVSIDDENKCTYFKQWRHTVVL